MITPAALVAVATAVQAGDFVSKVKCALCGRNVKDGEWETITLDGTEQKVCMNKYRCDQRRRQKKPKAVRYEVPQEASWSKHAWQARIKPWLNPKM